MASFRIIKRRKKPDVFGVTCVINGKRTQPTVDSREKVFALLEQDPSWRGEGLTVEDLCRRFLRRFDRSIYDHEYFMEVQCALLQHVIPALGQLELKFITHEDVYPLAEKLEDEYALHTAHGILKVFENCCRQAVMEGLMREDPVAAAKAEIGRRPKPKPVHSIPHHHRNALLINGGKARLAQLLALEAGLTELEIRGLDRSNVRNGIMSITHQTTPQRQRIEVPRAQQRRDLIVTPAIAEEMAKYPPEGLFYCKPDGSPLNHMNLAWLVWTANVRAGLVKNLKSRETPYTLNNLRWQCAIDWRHKENLTNPQIAKRLGYKYLPNLQQRLRLHPKLDQISEELANIEASFFAGRAIASMLQPAAAD